MELVEIVPILELKGNFISVVNRNYLKWSRRKYFLMEIKNRYKLVDIIINIKENIFDRIIDMAFGYYPIRISDIKINVFLRAIRKISYNYKMNINQKSKGWANAIIIFYLHRIYKGLI